MTDGKNILGVTNWSDNTTALEQQLAATKEKLHFSRTMKERQQLLNLENEVGAARQRVKDLRALAYSTAVRNRPEIERLKLETARLFTESISLDNESVMLEQALKAKYRELTELRQQIEADKNSI
jgi:hypothetical protein